jgi:hypothetical protein
MPTMAKIFQRCCPQCREMIAIVACNADNFSALLPTTRKSALISVHVCFSALLPTMPIIFHVLDHNGEKGLALLLTQWKNYRRC